MAFVHLHTHTQYSLLDGSNKIADYVARVRELGMSAAAITDHGVMYGVIDFYKACTEAGIKPILGCEVYVAPASRFDQDAAAGATRYYHLILLAENNRGYENLSKLVSLGFTEGYYYKPRVDKELLAKYHEGLICLSACLAGEVATLLAEGNEAAARETAKWYAETFGKDHYYLELQDHGIPAQKRVNAGLLRLHQELGIPLVATNDCHYTLPQDWEAHDVLLCIQTAKKLSDTDRMRYAEGQYYVRSEEEMRRLFPYAQEAIDNTAAIAERCNVTIEFGVTKLPKFEVPEGYDSWTWLNKLCDDGLKERYPDEATEDPGHPLRERLTYELSVIRRMGYVDYFLIVWDYINYCREHGIAVGPGRGSAAGSIVSYCLKITNIDPIRHSLMFERFLNPERVSMPDIDVDFEYTRRQEVIDYVTEKYGKNRVMQIITFGTLAAKGVIRDVARVMELPYAEGDRLSRMIPGTLGITLDEAIRVNPDLKAAADADPTVAKLLSYCRSLEGLPRHASVHAAGVVICSAPAMELVPLARAQDGSVTTQFPMTTVEELGLLKMDFLGLKTLTVIKDAVRSVNEARAVPLDIDQIDLNDPASMALIASNHAEGVFQLESAGMQSFMRELKPHTFEDIIAGISLYRPGPMDFIPQYIAAKNDPSKIHYDTPELEPILKPTYGCIVYQEQVMQIVQQLAGYSLGRADLVRRAMSKKKQHVMEVERKNFIEGIPEDGVPGCVGNGIPADIAGRIYDSMMDFAKYAFNKSHAACYAVVAMQTAYLKAHYPAEFMAALMTSVIDMTGKLAGYIGALKEMGIRLAPPDINAGDLGFSVVRNAEGAGEIRYALTAVRGVGRGLVSQIVRERGERGPYRSMEDFCRRLAGTELNRRALENMIKAGAFDSLGGTRRGYLMEHAAVLDQAQQEVRDNIAGQMSLFDMMGDAGMGSGALVTGGETRTAGHVAEFDKSQLLMQEREVLGVYVSGHPLDEEAAFLKKHVSVHAADFANDAGTAEDEEGADPASGAAGASAPGEEGGPTVRDRERVVAGGMITGLNQRYTKAGQPMATFSLEDLTGTVEVIVFPKCFAEYGAKLREDARVLIRGRATVETDADARLIAEEIRLFSEVPRRIWIQFPDRASYDQGKEDLRDLFAGAHAERPGSDTCTVYLRAEKQKAPLDDNLTVKADRDLLAELKGRFGEENVKLV